MPADDRRSGVPDDAARASSSPPVGIRRARHADRDAVVAFTEDTWPALGGDYIPRVFEEWVDTDGDDQRTFVATLDDRPVGICQGVLLSDHEAWGQGMRVAPEHRGEGVSQALTEALFEWAGGRGATVCRTMVFSWNEAGLGQARAVGFQPTTAFRWLELDADPDATVSAAHELRRDPAVAWSAYQESDAARHLRGLGLDLAESWSFAEVTADRLATAPAAVALVDGDRRRAMTYRTRTFERAVEDGDEPDDDEPDGDASVEGDPDGDPPADGEMETWAEYGVGAWTDHEALRALAAVVARDAAGAGADRARVLVPDTPRHVSDAAYARVSYDDDPDFILERDLTAYATDS